MADFSGLKIGEKLFSFILSKQQQLAVTKGSTVKFSEKISNRFARADCWWAEVKQFSDNLKDCFLFYVLRINHRATSGEILQTGEFVEIKS